jgi:hypothetical protein
MEVLATGLGRGSGLGESLMRVTGGVRQDTTSKARTAVIFRQCRLTFENVI